MRKTARIGEPLQRLALGASGLLLGETLAGATQLTTGTDNSGCSDSVTRQCCPVPARLIVRSGRSPFSLVGSCSTHSIYVHDHLLSARDRTLPWNLGFEITQPRPERALAQVHFCDADRAPFPGLGQHAAVLAKDGGEHPVARHVFVSAADEIDMVLARTSAPVRDCS